MKHIPIRLINLFLFLFLIITLPSTYDRATFPKSILFFACTSILLFYTLWFFLKQKFFSFYYSSITPTILLFTLFSSISLILSPHKITSLFGTYPHYNNGFTGILAGIILFFSILIFFSKDNVLGSLIFIFIGITINVFFGLYQYMSTSGWLIGFRPSALYRNPIEFSIMLLIGYCIGFYLSLKNPTKFKLFKYLMLLILLLYIIGILIVATRSVWLVFILINFLLISVLIKYCKHEILTNRYFVIGIYTLTTIIIFVTYAFIIKHRILDFFASNIQTNSLLVRFEEWLASIKLCWNNPFWGNGIGCFYLFIKQYFSENISPNTAEINTDILGARNQFLTYAVELGFIGLSIFCFLCIKTIDLFFQHLKILSENALEIIFIFILWFSITLHNFFYDFTVTSYVLWWTFLAFLLISMGKVKYRTITWKNTLINKLFLVSMVIPIFMLVFTVRFFVADLYFTKGLKYDQQQSYQLAIQKIAKSIVLNPYNTFYSTYVAQIYSAAENPYQNITVANQLIEETIEQNPLDEFPYHVGGMINYQNAEGNPEYYVIAKNYAEKKLSLNPQNPVYWDDFGLVLRELGNYQEAIAWFNKVLNVKPDYLQSYWHLAETYEKQEQWQQAKNTYETLLKYIPGNQEILGRIKKIDQGKLRI